MTRLPWTPIEDAVLARMLADHPLASIARALGRSEHSVGARANALGLSRGEARREAMRGPLGRMLRAGRTPKEVGRMLGIDGKTAKRWMDAMAGIGGGH